MTNLLRCDCPCRDTGKMSPASPGPGLQADGVPEQTRNRVLLDIPVAAVNLNRVDGDADGDASRCSRDLGAGLVAAQGAASSIDASPRVLSSISPSSARRPANDEMATPNWCRVFA